MRETKDVSLVHILAHLEKRQGRVKTRAINLNNLEVIQHDRFTVDGMEFYVAEIQEGVIDKLPIKQLCQAIGMNLGFYLDNPNPLNHHIFNDRLRALDEGERMIRWIETDKGNRLLAILPMAHQAPTYLDVISPIMEKLPSNHVIRLTNYDTVDDDHRLTIRVSLLDFPVDVREVEGRHDAAELGFFVDVSEDGGGKPKMTLTNMVYNQTCNNGAMVTYDQHPYFQFNYRGIRGVDLGAAIKSAVDRFTQDLTAIETRLNESSKRTFTKAHAEAYMKGLESRRDMSLGFLRKLRSDFSSAEVTNISHYRVINMITEAAQKLPYDSRVQHEFAAGNLLRLNLPAEQAA